MNSFKNRKTDKGFTLIEVLIAMSVIMTISVLSAGVFYNAKLFIVNAELKSMAKGFACELMETKYFEEELDLTDGWVAYPLPEDTKIRSVNEGVREYRVTEGPDSNYLILQSRILWNRL